MESNASKTGEKLPFKVKLAYGLSGYTSFITWTIFSLYGLYFFTDVVGLGAAFAGAIISLGTLWDAITDPIIGSISDHLKCKAGRRRPLIIGAALPFAVISILLFTNFGLGEAASKIYYVVVILLYYTAQTVLDISSSALGSEMTLDYDERSSLATYKNFFCMFVVIAISPTLVMSSSIGWSATIAIYMVVALVFIFFLWKVTKGYERHPSTEAPEKFSFKDIGLILKNKPARIVMIIFALAIFGNSINLSLQTYYFIYNVGLSDGQIATVMLVSGILSCFATFGVDWLCLKVSKKMAWVLACGLEGLSMIVLVIGIIQPGQIAMVYVLVLLMALGLAAIYQIPWSMIPDCVDVSQLATGKRDDGIVFGFIAFIQKCAGAIAIALVGTLLEVIKYVPDAEQTAETLSGMKLMYGGVCGGILVITVIIVLAYPLSKEKHTAVLEALDAKEKGEDVDLSKFSDLF